MRLIAQCSGRKKLRNGREYTILSIDQDVVLRYDPPGLEALVENGSDSETETSTASTPPPKVVSLPRDKFFHQLRLPYARTYASVQGLTVTGLIALHDVDHPHMCHRKLYVGLSRAKGREFIVVP
jgi:hypothetical protein